MEWHRGEFIPLKVTTPDGKKGEGKTVKITQESADQLNLDFSKTRGVGVQVKYVLVDEDQETELSELAKEYQQLSKKKAYHGWDAKKLRELINELKQ